MVCAAIPASVASRTSTSTLIGGDIGETRSRRAACRPCISLLSASKLGLSKKSAMSVVNCVLNWPKKPCLFWNCGNSNSERRRSCELNARLKASAFSPVVHSRYKRCSAVVSSPCAKATARISDCTSPPNRSDARLKSLMPSRWRSSASSASRTNV